MSDDAVSIDLDLTLELTKSGVCDFCKEPYLVNDLVDVKQNVKTRKGVAGHRRCWPNSNESETL